MSLSAFFLTNPLQGIPVIFVFGALLIGLYVVVRGADWLVDGSSSIAAHWSIPAIVIGLTVVAFGTSMPELIVNILSSVTGSTGLAIGNVVGSNIANILLILGATAVFRSLAVKENTVWKEIPMAFLAMILLWVMSNDAFLAGAAVNVLDRIDGFVFLAFFIIFLYYTFGISKVEGEAPKPEEFPFAASIGLVGLGIGALTLGGKITVDAATAFASSVGVSDALIGLTVVALGTSLPELVTSIAAARKGKADLAIGNVVGSNIFNIFWILGVSALIRPLPFDTSSSFDVLVAVAASLLLFISLFVRRFLRAPQTVAARHTLGRKRGIIFLILYVAYIAFAVWRG